jgi:hypothetical protein
MSLLELEAMGNLMRTAMQIAKRKDAFLEYEELLYLQDANGTELGQREHSRKTAKEMIKVATRVGREEIRLFLTTTNPIMNHKPHLCVKADKATDNDANQFEMINGRMNYLGSPVTSSLGLPLIDGEYTGADDPDSDEKEAGSGVCFNKILEVLEDYGVILIDKNNKSVYEWKDFPGVGLGISEQARSAVFDGEYCYQGKPGGNGEKNVKFLFKDPVRGYGDATFLVTHDAPHATDLLKGDGLNGDNSDYTRETVHKVVKATYSHFSRSPHRCRGLCSLAAEWGVEQKQLHYLFEIRFIASEVLVFSHFLTDLPAIVLYLRDEKQADDTSAEMKAKITGWLRIITQFKFVSTIITQLDIDLALKSFSVATQSDSLLVINYPDVRDDFKRSIEVLKTSLGANGKKHLDELSSGELRSLVTKNIARRVVQGEEDDEVICEHVETLSDGSVRSKLVLKLASAPRGGSATKTRMLAHQTPDVVTMLANFDARIPMPELYLKYADVFNFERMGVNSSDTAAFAALQVAGDDAVDWLQERYYPMLDAQIVKNQSLLVKIYVKENYSRFYDKDLAQPEWTSARKNAHVPKPHLKICGPGSIMETLFTNFNVTRGPIEQYLHIADDMICRSVTQCDTERVGSAMNLVKTDKRRCLGDSIFADLVFLAFNLPWLHEIDIKLLVKAWKEAGHKLPINKNDADSIVLTRLRNRESHDRGFFLKATSPFKPKDFGFLKKRPE